MLALVLGLLLFLGVHSTRIVADGWRSAQVARLGERGWKGAYTVASLVGFALLVWGYGQARQQPVAVWTPPLWTRHVAGLLMLGSFVLLAAAYVPRNAIKARVRHPMVLAVKVWALAHLLANGNLADILLFGSFLVWAVFCFRAARQRDRRLPPAPISATPAATSATIAAGLVAWAVFAWWLHRLLIGVQPFG